MVWLQCGIISYGIVDGTVNIKLISSGSKAQDKGDARNHCLQETSVYVVFRTPNTSYR